MDATVHIVEPKAKRPRPRNGDHGAITAEYLHFPLLQIRPHLIAETTLTTSEAIRAGISCVEAKTLSKAMVTFGNRRPVSLNLSCAQRNWRCLVTG